jgi:hypothetical protein
VLQLREENDESSRSTAVVSTMSRPTLERAALVKARDVHLELSAIEAVNQLRHLTLGSADVEAGQQEGNWVRTSSRHLAQRSKRSATGIVRVRRLKIATSGRRSSACG